MAPDRSTLAVRWSWLAAAALTIALLVWMSGWTGTGQPSAAIDAIWVLLTAGPYALAWIAAAIGFGWPLQKWLAPNIEDRMSIQIGLGIAAILFIDHALGVLGVLQWGGSTAAWAVIGGGLALLLIQVVRHQSHIQPSESTISQMAAAPAMCLFRCAAAPAVAVLLLAACSAPGVLWATEFGGFDALSYHLQLPQEWLALGSIQPLEHNVYSFLPGYVEAAYYHLAILRGDGIESAYSCQLLHAGITLLTAFVVARLSTRIAGPFVGAIAAIGFLGTPWMIVVGSLGYNEMPALLMLGVGLIVLHEKGLKSMRCGSIIGILAATACGAKLTSIGFVAAPLAAMMLMTIRPRRWPAAICFTAASGFLVLLPYLLRNNAHCGNPLFPFATQVFGSAHWTAEQVTVWNRGHLPDVPLTQRLAAFWNQVLRFGIGENPSSTEPWKAQWSILPWLAFGGVVAGVCLPRTRLIAVRIAIILLIQIAFWMWFTHLKSRFFLPASVSMVLGSVIGATVISGCLPRSLKYVAGGVIIAALIAWSIQPMLVFRSEGRGAPSVAVGQINAFSGDGLTDEQRSDLGTSTFPAVALNFLLPQNSRTLAIGFATPLYVRADLTYCTTWDRGPLSLLMQQFPNQPDRWAAELLMRGFTHLIVDENMLAIWERFGWNDPAMTAVNVRALTSTHASLLYKYPGGVSIHELLP